MFFLGDIMKSKSNTKKRKKNSSNPEFPYISDNRMKEIQNTFEILGIDISCEYHGADEISKNFKKATLLKSEGVSIVTSSDSCLE